MSDKGGKAQELPGRQEGRGSCDISILPQLTWCCVEDAATYRDANVP